MIKKITTTIIAPIVISVAYSILCLVFSKKRLNKNIATIIAIANKPIIPDSHPAPPFQRTLKIYTQYLIIYKKYKTSPPPLKNQTKHMFIGIINILFKKAPYALAHKD